MAKCPNCGGEVANPRKSWKMAGRPDRAGKRTELTIGLFDCPNCKKAFRVVLGKRKIWGIGITKRSAFQERGKLRGCQQSKDSSEGMEI